MTTWRELQKWWAILLHPSYYWKVGFKVVDTICLLPPWMFDLALYFVISVVVKLPMWCIALADGTISMFWGKSECLMSFQCLFSTWQLTSFTTACTKLFAYGCLRAWWKYEMSPIISAYCVSYVAVWVLPFSIVTITWGEIFCKGGWGRHVILLAKEVMLTGRLSHGCTHFTIPSSWADRCDASLWSLKASFHFYLGQSWGYLPMIVGDISQLYIPLDLWFTGAWN